MRAFQRMGLAGAARDVAVASEVQLRRAGRIGAHLPRPLRWLPRLAHRAFGVVAGYGYRPWRLAWLLSALWLACAGFFMVAAERGAVAPTLSLGSAMAPRDGACSTSLDGAIDWTRCAALPPAYPSFSAMAFSLEHALPFIDLQQRRLWTVAGDRAAEPGWGVSARAVAWCESALGWTAWLLALACAVVPLVRNRALA
jgi:hypothetical protein